MGVVSSLASAPAALVSAPAALAATPSALAGLATALVTAPAALLRDSNCTPECGAGAERTAALSSTSTASDCEARASMSTSTFTSTSTSASASASSATSRSEEAGETADSPRNLRARLCIGRLMGEGRFGVAYACRDLMSGEELAVKVVDLRESTREALAEEARIQRLLLHDNIVRLREVISDESCVSLVMDLYAGGDLVSGMDRLLKERGALRCAELARLDLQMATAIEYLHWKCIVHRDVKAENFVTDRADILDPQCQVALADFGAACQLRPQQRLSDQTGTRHFWAPEVFAKDYGLKIDVWALGVTLSELLKPRSEHCEDGKALPVEQDDSQEPCAEYLRSLLQADEDSRLTASEAVAHRWRG